ncbi:hypothetical protein JCM21714_2688 [Gracilibacillus boraciitolerans JCM 21714]|uniref:Uncharacterized protein n=1 Tax=Gracilibacillus boraciitolerans JCM 21714 TaxID=1298598 RepID=W4VJL3_9BACI|nr:hypothetical protein [Gracilibacillus boraciitolerans]GAE93590.1 hypothetical protein JCM21714_2688 [Gracilibacillus boraciitolerans JCM 21714]
MIYILFFLVGFGLSISGGISIILYLNFIPAGLTFIDYLAVIQSKVECYFFLAGIVIMGIAVQKISLFSVK